MVHGYKKAKQVYRLGFRIFVYPTYSCSRCINAVDSAGRILRSGSLRGKLYRKALFSPEKIHIVFGRADSLRLEDGGRIVCIGRCSKAFAEKYGGNCLDACPPDIETVTEYLIRKVLS